MAAEFEGALDGRLKAWFSIRVPVAISDELLRRMASLPRSQRSSPDSVPAKYAQATSGP
jgi:hypothetical protein